jgi:hypothetical protein
MEKTIELDSGLQVIQKPEVHVQAFLNDNFGDNLVSSNINYEADIVHRNYLSYLEMCWANHYPVVLTPDIIWYTILCEIVGIVDKNVEKYRSLFSESKEKQDIIVHSGSLTEIPLESVMEALRYKVPTDIEKFLPEFSTSGERSISAFYTAFADMVSPYYNYMMYVCGLPVIKILGTQEDWQGISDRVENMRHIFPEYDVYFQTVKGIVNGIVKQFSEPDLEFLRDIVRVDNCGSGSETELYGWFTQLFVEQPSTPRRPANFSSHISQIKYKQLNTERDYIMYQGIFDSRMVVDFMLPRFSQVIKDVTENG